MPFFQSKNWKSHSKRNLLFVDLELTGLDSSQHEIIEIAALLVSPDDLRIINSYYTKVLPSHLETADEISLQIANYDPKEWKSAISLSTMLKELSTLDGEVILAGWSVVTEYDFLTKALEQEGIPYFFDNYLLEVWSLAYLRYCKDPTVEKINLQSISAKLNIPLLRHKPDSDIRATYEIFKNLVVE